MEVPKLRVTFDEPRDGWWDGGKKSGGDFEPKVCTHILNNILARTRLSGGVVST
jgi:hypothetical protein